MCWFVTSLYLMGVRVVFAVAIHVCMAEYVLGEIMYGRGRYVLGC